MLSAFLLTCTALPCLQADPTPAVSGLDHVRLCEGAEVAGDPELVATHGRYLYEFADAASRAHDGMTREVVETISGWREDEGVLLPVARSAREGVVRGFAICSARS